MNTKVEHGGFNLIELLIVIAIIAITAALLLPALNNTKRKAQRSVCESNLKQINLGIRLYSDDSSDLSPALTRGESVWFSYRELLHGYLGLKGQPSPNDKVFACPADIFHYAPSPSGAIQLVPSGHFEQSNYFFSSYELNAANQATNVSAFMPGVEALPGISGRKLSSIKHSARTVLIAEASSFLPYSWHEPRQPQVMPGGWEMPVFNDARNVVSFVDGHVSYIKIYWDSAPMNSGYYSMAFYYDPPAGYAYQWSGD